MEDIKLAAKKIIEGNIVAFPTETVYGLGADATNDTACKKIYALKSRPANNPLIVHVSSLMQAENIGVFSNEAKEIARSLWPGPISLVVPLREGANIAQTILAKLETIAIRMPANKIALQLITQANTPIAAPSANPSGYISPTTAQHVREHFGDAGIMILEGDKSAIGIESTIVDFSCTKPTILRQGFITKETIEEILQQEVRVYQDTTFLKAPGMMEKHYSPKTPIRLNAESLNDGEIGLGFGNCELGGEFNLSREADLIEAASNLYSYLRELDKLAATQNFTQIAVAKIPNESIGLAINDRLKRAAVK